MNYMGIAKNVPEDVRKAYANPQSTNLFWVNNEVFDYNQINTVEKFYTLIRSTCEKGECLLMFGAENRYSHTDMYVVKYYRDDDYTVVENYAVAPWGTRGNNISYYYSYDTLQHFCHAYYKAGIPYCDRGPMWR